MPRRLLSLFALLLAATLSGRAAKADPVVALDTPTAGQTVAGVVLVSGFVLDFAGVDRVELLVDGVVRSRAVTNMPRPDVLALFPSYADSPTSNPGFMTSFNARNLSAGPHSVAIRVTETGNSKTFDLAAETVFVVGTNQPPFGAIDIPAAADSQGVSGALTVIGWAADDSGTIDHIDFLVDGKVVAGAVGTGQPSTAVYGSPRPDVFSIFPDVPNSFNSGFAANIDTTSFVDGVHVLSVRAFDWEGASNVLDTRTVQVINNGANLPPFGFLDVPLDKASILCSPGFAPDLEPVQFYKNVVAGWALDVGARLDKGQVSYVEFLIDGQIIANSRVDCVKMGSVMANCYGVNRPDVARAYPGFVNADNSGFLFLFTLVPDPGNGLFDVLIPGPVGLPVVGGFVASGKHTLSIRVGDEKETVTQIAAISVDVLCDIGPDQDQPAFGYIDFPTELQFVKGVTSFSGWAFDYDNGGQAPWVNGVKQIDVDIDGQVVTSIVGPYIARADVPANDFRVPSTPFTSPPVAFVGWGLNVDTGKLSDGQHDLVVYAWDTDPATGGPRFRSEIGRRKFVVLNNTATKE